MRIREEIKTFTDGANELSVKMQILSDDLEAGKKTPQEVATELDQMAREQILNMQTIKDLAYWLGRGEERVSTVRVPS